MNAALAHPPHIHHRMRLLLAHRLVNSGPVFLRRVRKTQQHQRHQLRRQELVICQKMQHHPALAIIVQPVRTREIRPHPIATHPQLLRPARRIRQRDRPPRRIIRGHDRPRIQLLLQRLRKQHTLRDFPHLNHAGKHDAHPQIRTSGFSEPCYPSAPPRPDDRGTSAVEPIKRILGQALETGNHTLRVHHRAFPAGVQALFR